MNMTTVNEFVRSYSKAIEESTSAIFAGAGLSKLAGCVNWKELMREIAVDVNLDVDKETDLIALAQYHVNEHGGRAKINQVLIEEFTDNSAITENHRILARLPIRTYWTTNYDKVIETSLEANSKKVDVKIVSQNLSQSVPNSDAMVYKMHGDVTLPHEAVLTKDDYERYNETRQLFTTALQGDLVSKTFLFIGFSFDDPNLSQILSRIRILLGENQRQHYCFMKTAALSDFETKEEYLYAKIRQNLKIGDLKRYCIKVILLDDYAEITTILTRLHNIYRRKNVFISASASDYGTWGEQRVFEFATSLSREIIRSGANVATGFGLGIGSCIISGALEELYGASEKRTEERLKARPFPQVIVGTLPLQELWKKYREDMLQDVGISIFIFGNKKEKDTGQIIEASGMLQEFEIGFHNGGIPIPIGATGYTAQKIWNKVMGNFSQYIPDYTLEPLFADLGNTAKSDKELITTIIQIIKRLRVGE